MESLAFDDVSTRLARFLVDQVAERGERRNGSGQVRLPLALTHQEMANLLGTTRETLTATLNRFVDAGIVAVESRGTLRCSTPASYGPAPISNPTPMIEPASRPPSAAGGQEFSPGCRPGAGDRCRAAGDGAGVCGDQPAAVLCRTGAGAVLLIALLVSGALGGRPHFAEQISPAGWWGPAWSSICRARRGLYRDHPAARLLQGYVLPQRYGPRRSSPGLWWPIS